MMALRLTIPSEPYWLDLDFGVRMKVRPLSSPMMGSIRAKAQRLAKAMQEPQEAEKLLGIMDAAEMSEEEVQDGLFQHFLTVLLAQASVIEWEGLLDEKGNLSPVNDDTVREAMCIPLLAERFYGRYLLPQARLVQEGNGSGLPSNGTSGEARPIARAAAKRSARNAPTPKTRRTPRKAKPH